MCFRDMIFRTDNRVSAVRDTRDTPVSRAEKNLRVFPAFSTNPAAYIRKKKNREGGVYVYMHARGRANFGLD